MPALFGFELHESFSKFFLSRVLFHVCCKFCFFCCICFNFFNDLFEFCIPLHLVQSLNYLRVNQLSQYMLSIFMLFLCFYYHFLLLLIIFNFYYLLLSSVCEVLHILIIFSSFTTDKNLHS